VDPFSVWAGVVIGGVLALALARLKWSRDEEGRPDLGDSFGIWIGGVGPVLGGIAALIVWLLR
jgi:hypothetical protein